MRTLTGPLRRLDAVAFSPDGAELAAVGGYAGSPFDPTAAADRGVTIWRLAGDPAAPRHLFPDRTARRAVYSADGRWLYVTLVSRTAASPNPLGLFAVDRRLGAEPSRPLSGHFLLAARGGRLLTLGWAAAAADAPWEVRLASHAGRRTVWRRQYPGHTSPAQIALLADGRAVVLEQRHAGRGRDTFTLALRTAATGEEVARVPMPGGTEGELVAAPDGGWLVMNAGGSLYAWRAGGLPTAPPRKIVFGKRHCTGVAFLPDGRSVLAAGNDGGVRRIALDTGATAATHAWQAGKARSVAVAPDGLTAAVGTDGGAVVVFDLD